MNCVTYDDTLLVLIEFVQKFISLCGVRVSLIMFYRMQEKFSRKKSEIGISRIHLRKKQVSRIEQH